MVIDKLLKVNSNDPKAEELRKRLAALQGKNAPEQPVNPADIPKAGPTRPPTWANSPSSVVSAGNAPLAGGVGIATLAGKPVSQLDADLQKLGAAEQQRVIMTREPELKLKEERTLALVMTQISEVIALQTESAKKLKEAESKNQQLQKELELFKDKHEELLQKMNGIDSRLEKFMGLYEVITNQYNPFLAGGTQPARVAPVQASAAQVAPSLPAASAPPPRPSVAPNSVPTTPFTQTLKEQLVAQKEKSEGGVRAQGSEFAVEDSLTKEKTLVTVKAEDAATADARFKRVEELLADLHEKHAAEGVTTAEAGASVRVPDAQAANNEIHLLLQGFEERLTKYLDSTLQEKLHERFATLEGKLQNEIRDALRDEIEAVQRDEEELQNAFVELQSLVQAKEGPARDALEQELATLQRQVGAVREEIQAISPDLYFRLADGRVLKSLPDLRDALANMPLALFAQHVDAAAQRNDFATWVEHALLSPTLAELLREQHTPEDMRAAIIAHDGLND
jgi:DNA repair exonuclease SbcCD ATPase subunit